MNMRNLCDKNISMSDKCKFFKAVFAKYKEKNIVIYGTGKIAEEIIFHNSEFNFIGVMDEKRKDGYFLDKKILSERELLSEKTELIIIIEEIHEAYKIYESIFHLTEIYEIPIFYVTGMNMRDAFKKIDNQKINYMSVNEEYLKNEIKKHDVISFDVFDTLIMRTTLFPKDVFELVKKRAEEENIFLSEYTEIRVEAERKLSGNIPNIYQIYNEIQRVTGISDNDREILLNLEIEIENKVIVSRNKMIDVFNYALECGKTVYLVSDMYLPKEILEPLINKLGISGYQDVIVSCDYGTNKLRDLFEILKIKIGEKNCLHVGDNVIADMLGALSAGLDVFYVKSAYEMLNASNYFEIIKSISTYNEKAIVGLLISYIFNNPFSLCGKIGKIDLNFKFDIGYVVLAPILIGFFQWMKDANITLQFVKEKNDLAVEIDEISSFLNTTVEKDRILVRPEYVAWLVTYEERYRRNILCYKVYLMQDSIDKKQTDGIQGSWYIDNEILRKKSGKYLNSNIKLIKEYLDTNKNCFIQEQMGTGVKEYIKYYMTVLYIPDKEIKPEFSAALLNQFDMATCLRIDQKQ